VRDKRLLIFANQSAGSMKSSDRPPLEQCAREAGFEPEIVYTRSGRQLLRLLRERVVGKELRVAIAGGDGTVHLAVQVLAGTDVKLGILPQGTANNFATALKLPRDLPAAFQVIAAGYERRVDLGRVGDQYFTEAAGVGLFADLLAMTGGGHNLGNVLRGIRVILSAIVFNRPRRLAITLDGERNVENVLNVTVANTFFVGYNIPIAPDAKVTDARLDAIVIESLTRREMISYYRAIRRKEHLQLPKVQVARVREVKLSARRSIAVHVDDRVRLRTPVTIQVVPRALRVLVARGEPAAQEG
jgi:diacylglycerol kinase (ATP)